jgi:acyl-coenzyme A synthetase/AMP-(fatty) acid ligase
VATALRRNGIAARSRVLVWLESPLDTVVAYAALTGIDAVPILRSPTWSGEIIEKMIDRVDGIVAMITTDHRVADSRSRFPELVTLDWRSIAAEMASCERYCRTPEFAGEQSYVVVHTSGTTGVPKLVDCSARSVHFNALFQVITHWLSGLRGYCAVAVSPVHGRTVVGLYAALIRKVPLMMLADYSPENVERMVRKYRPEFLETHPNHFRAWQHLAETGTFESVRIFGTGFDVVHPDTIQALLDGSQHRFAMYFEIYGQNESGPVAIRMHLKRGRLRRSWRRSTSALSGHPIGWKVPLVKVRIVDDNGVPVPRGIPGHITVRSRGVFSGYINRRDLTSRNYPQNRWWDTGDWGTRSRLGALTLVDRDSEKVSVTASGIGVEDVVLERFPNLLEVIVLEADGVLQPIVSVRPGTPFDGTVWAAATRGLVLLAEPVIIPDDKFPRTVTGKVQRKVLLAMLESGELTRENVHVAL